MAHLVLVINHVMAVAEQQPNCDNLFIETCTWIEQAFDRVHDASDLFNGRANQPLGPVHDGNVFLHQ